MSACTKLLNLRTDRVCAVSWLCSDNPESCALTNALLKQLQDTINKASRKIVKVSRISKLLSFLSYVRYTSLNSLIVYISTM